MAALGETPVATQPQAPLAYFSNRDESPFLCQSCGCEGHVREGTYKRNIGALFLRFSGGVNGIFCRKCHSSHFWSQTAVCVFAGWWGVLSLFIFNPAFIIGNIVEFSKSRSLPQEPAPQLARLDDDAILRLTPHFAWISEQFKYSPHPFALSRELARLAGVTPGQAYLYVLSLVQAAQQNRAPSSPPASAN